MVMKKRTGFNTKRCISDDIMPEALEMLTQRVSYGGNPEHKRNPGDFGLTPPSQPRPDKSLCDDVEIFSKAMAVQLLKEGIRRGLVSQSLRNGFPQNIWAVTANGVPVEAQLENVTLGIYHGYPMPDSDPFAQKVISRWRHTDE